MILSTGPHIDVVYFGLLSILGPDSKNIISFRQLIVVCSPDLMTWWT